MRLLLDQGLPRSTIHHLDAAGVESVHVGEKGLATASDEKIIDFARQGGWIVVTLDADFHALLALSGATSPSVVRIRIEGQRAEGLATLLGPPRKFVAAGPYKFVRNPMYIGGFVVLLGFGLYEQSATILLFTLPWLLLAHLFVILYEEPHLHATFGTPYDAYCHSVRRWLPRRFPVA